MSLFREPHDACFAEDMTVVSEEYPVYSVMSKLEAKSPALSARVFGSPPMSPPFVACASESVDSLLADACYHSRDCDKGAFLLPPALGATTWEWPATSPLLFSDSGDCKGKEYVGGWPKREEKEIVDNLAMASPMKELSPNEVFVFNIKYSTTKAQLKAEFSRCGAVASISLPFDKKSSRNKGYAFVTFERDESVERAIVELNGFYLNGRPLGVRRKNEAKWPSARSLRSAHTPPANGSLFMFATDVLPLSAASRQHLVSKSTTIPSPTAALSATATLFVGNIPFQLTRSQIMDLFVAASGAPLKAVRLVTDALGVSRGFCYVDFYSEAAATKALSLNGHVISGRVLRVNYAEGYQPDFRKKKWLQMSSSPSFEVTSSMDSSMFGTTNATVASALNTATYVPPIGEGYVLQVPRGYALVPIVFLPMAATCVTPPRYFVASATGADMCPTLHGHCAF